MSRRSHTVFALVFLLSILLAIPFDVVAQVPASRSAGKISRMIPTVNVQRGARVTPASTTMAVLWGDTLTTNAGGRARVTLDDGSILNVGSDSSIRVVSHDAALQRTSVQLAYGRLRSSAVRLARAGSSFEVRTPTAVAGVVGTDFFLEFANNINRLVVFEGKVNFCNLAGKCVVVGAGMTSTARGNEEPSTPSPTPPSDITAANNASSVGGGAGGAGGAAGGVGISGGALAGHGLLFAVGIVAAGVVPGVIIASTVAHTHKCGCNNTVTAVP